MCADQNNHNGSGDAPGSSVPSSSHTTQQESGSWFCNVQKPGRRNRSSWTGEKLDWWRKATGICSQVVGDTCHSRTIEQYCAVMHKNIFAALFSKVLFFDALRNEQCQWPVRVASAMLFMDQKYFCGMTFTVLLCEFNSSQWHGLLTVDEQVFSKNKLVISENSWLGLSFSQKSFLPIWVLPSQTRPVLDVPPAAQWVTKQTLLWKRLVYCLIIGLHLAKPTSTNHFEMTRTSDTFFASFNLPSEKKPIQSVILLTKEFDRSAQVLPASPPNYKQKLNQGQKNNCKFEGKRRPNRAPTQVTANHSKKRRKCHNKLSTRVDSIQNKHTECDMQDICVLYR